MRRRSSPRSSPDKNGIERVENYESNDADDDEDERGGGGGGGGDDRDAIEPLREAVDSLQIADREGLVEGAYGSAGGLMEGSHGSASGHGSEIREECATASSSSMKSTDGDSTTSSTTSSTRQRHSSIQRVEHLHRFSLPPTVAPESAPVVNVLPGPVVRKSCVF